MSLTLIAAVSKNGVIGSNKNDALTTKTGMLWHCPEDLKLFVKNTLGSVVVMGRKTAIQVGKLKNRECIMLSRDKNIEPPEGFSAVLTIDDFLELIKDGRDYAICGGAEIYASLMPYCSNAIISHMNFEVDGDILMPLFNENWERKGELEFTEFVSAYYLNTNIRGFDV